MADCGYGQGSGYGAGYAAASGESGPVVRPSFAIFCPMCLRPRCVFTVRCRQGVVFTPRQDAASPTVRPYSKAGFRKRERRKQRSAEKAALQLRPHGPAWARSYDENRGLSGALNVGVSKRSSVAGEKASVGAPRTGFLNLSAGTDRRPFKQRGPVETFIAENGRFCPHHGVPPQAEEHLWVVRQYMLANE